MSWVFREGTGLAGHCGSCSAGYEPEWLQMLSLDFSYFLANCIHENLAAFPLCLLNGMSQILKQRLQVPPWDGPRRGNTE